MPPPVRRAAPAALALALLAAGCASPGGTAAEPRPFRMDPDPAYLDAGGSRSFHVAYTGKVKEIPAGTKSLRVWLPVPQDTPMQIITGLEFSREAVVNTEPRFGNRYAYFEIENPGPEVEVVMAFDCTRMEQRTALGRIEAAGEGSEEDAAAAEFLRDDALTIVDERMRKMSEEICAGKATTVAKARAIYDHVAARMTYDKSGTGWGRGDTNFACDAGTGNCTDFHALFMSLCRAQGIPAGFEIGLYAPYRRGSAEALGGYHCWSFFRVPGRTWVPVDISEADRNPDRMDYFFGNHTDNRVTLSVGRDLVLVPAQAGEPLNFMVDPYAEADGRKVLASKSWTLKDLD